MTQINFFHSNQSKDAHHEDQLTWAFLTLLKYAPTVFQYFYESVCEGYQYEEGSEHKLAPFAQFIKEDIDFETQVQSKQFETSQILSVLFTNENLKMESEVAPRDRTATYDGVISIGDKLTMIIAHKSDSKDVWEDQLKPALAHIESEETHVFPQPKVIDWKDTIVWLNDFVESERNNYAERKLVESFLSFINQHFSNMSPHDRLSYYYGDDRLIQERIENLLKERFKEELVKYHRGWGFYVELPYRFIRKAGVILHENESKYIEISLYFADTQGQSKAFYPVELNLDDEDWEGWYISPNFHFAYMTSNKVWLYTPTGHEQKYVDYWNENAANLSQQQGHEEVKEFLKNLVDKQLVEDKPIEMQTTIYNSNMHNMNVCAGLGFLYAIDLQEAEKMDNNGTLASFIEEKIAFCLQKVKGVDIEGVKKEKALEVQA